MVASVGGILSGVLDKEFDKFMEVSFNGSLQPLSESVKSLITYFDKAVEVVRNQKDREYTEFISERIVKMGLDIYISTLFLDAATKNDRKAKLAEIWIAGAKLRIKENSEFVINGDRNIVDYHTEIIV